MKPEQSCLHEAPRMRRGPACITPGRTILPFIALSVLLACAAVFAGCLAAPGGQDAAAATGTVSKVEVIHFTTPNQCYSCVVLGTYAEETVRTHFADEIASGKMSFDHVGIADPAQRDIVERYGATGSSLWIGVYDDQGRFFPEEDIRVWYKLNDKPGFSAYLKTLLEMRLRGDLTR